MLLSCYNIYMYQMNRLHTLILHKMTGPIYSMKRNHLQLEIGHGGSIYIPEIGRCYKSELPTLHPPKLINKHLPAHHWRQKKLQRVSENDTPILSTQKPLRRSGGGSRQRDSSHRRLSLAKTVWMDRESHRKAQVGRGPKDMDEQLGPWNDAVCS